MTHTSELESGTPSTIVAAAEPPCTPLAAALAPEALSVSRGVRTAALFSDETAELSGLLHTAAVFDGGARARLRITGEDRVRWLNGMVTNNIKALTPGEHSYSFVLNAQGRIQGDATVLALPTHLLLETEATQLPALTAHLDHFIIMDDVELAPVEDETALGLAGPQAASVLAAAGLPAPAPGFSAAAAGITLLAEQGHALPHYTLWTSTEQAPALWHRLLAAGATAAGAHALEALRILEAMPLYGTDIHDKTLPQETGQSRALNFSKGCYLGQEIVERIRARATVHRGLRQFALEGSPASAGTQLFAGEAAIGELTSVANINLPGLPRQVALATVRLEALTAGAPLHYAGGAAHLLARPPLAAAST